MAPPLLVSAGIVFDVGTAFRVSRAGRGRGMSMPHRGQPDVIFVAYLPAGKGAGHARCTGLHARAPGAHEPVTSSNGSRAVGLPMIVSKNVGSVPCES